MNYLQLVIVAGINLYLGVLHVENPEPYPPR